MAQQVINVGAVPNDGQGDPIRTSFEKCNNNFNQLYSRVQTSPPPTFVGSIGDQAGMYAYDNEYFYYCFADYDGTSTIWNAVQQAGNISATQISYGTSNVRIDGLNGNATFNITGTSNVAVVSPTGINVTGNVDSDNINATNIYASVVDGSLVTGTTISTAGNITGGYFFGDGSLLTGIITTVSNVTNGTSRLEIDSANANITANVNGVSNVVVITSTGITALTVTATGNVVGGNINTAGVLSSTGNVVGGNLVTSGLISAAANITGGNITTGGKIVSQGTISGVGNIITDGYFVGNFAGNVVANIVVPGSNTQVLFNTNGNVDAVAGLVYNKDANTLGVLGIVSAQGNIISGNVTTGGQVSATSNITGGNVLTGGLISAAANITGGNITTGGTISSAGAITGSSHLGAVVSVSGNVTGANLNATTSVNAVSHVGTTVSVTGDITGGNIVTGGLITATGNINGQNINATQKVVAVGNVTGGNITSGGIASITGNITGGNLISNGVITSTGNILAGGSFTAVGAVTANGVNSTNGVSASGNITGGNVFSNGAGSVAGNLSVGINVAVSGAISAIGNITGAYLIGNGSQLTGINTIGTALTNGTTNITTASNGNANITINGTSNVVVVANTGLLVSGLISASGNIVTPTVTLNSGVLTTGLVSATGNVTGGNVLTGGLVSATSTITSSANITGGNILTGGLISSASTVTGTSHLGNVVSVTANITGGNILTGGLISASSNITSASNISGSYILGNGVSLSSVTGVKSVIYDVTDNTSYAVAIIDPSSSPSNINRDNSGLTFNPSTNILYAGNVNTGGVMSATGNVTGGNLVTAGLLSVNSGNVTGTVIVNAGGNGVGNIGSATGYFNTIHAKATSAQYADLAEKYLADADYEPGTVLSFGGSAEVTVSMQDADATIIGVVSTNPSYIMNGSLDGKHVATVALTGRVPCKVQGPVTRGAMMVSAGNGRARAEAKPEMGTVIGKALENFDGDQGTIEIVVGRL